MTAYSVRTVSGETFVWSGEMPFDNGSENAVSVTVPLGDDLVLLKCGNGTLINLACVETMTPARRLVDCGQVALLCQDAAEAQVHHVARFGPVALD